MQEDHKDHNQFTLLRERRFAPFFWTQFLGAFNDNLFKTALLTVIAFDSLKWTDIDPGLLTNLIPGLFILPFLLFSATAGQIADKYDKGQLARFVKLLEIGIMAIAAWGWYYHQFWLLVVAIFGMGMHSTLFGPVKYAYLPQHLKPRELIGGNGVVEMGTFVGILLGEIIGALLVANAAWGAQITAIAALSVAVIGWLVSRRIPVSAPPAPDIVISRNPFAEGMRNLSYSRQNRAVFLSMLGNSWFWFYGAILLAQFPLFAKTTLHGDYSVFVLLLVMFSVGIAVGSLLCERLSGRRIEIGLVPFGAIGLSVFGFELYLASRDFYSAVALDIASFVAVAGSWRILFACGMIGVFGGLYIVPLFAVIQTRCNPAHVSRTIAGMNILNALFMVVAALCGMLMHEAGLSIPQIFMMTALMNVFVALFIFLLLPEFLLRFLAWILVSTVYRVRKVNLQRIPETGGAVLVCNHVSYMDAIVIMASCPRPVRFVMDHRIFRVPFLSWVFRTANAIPIAPAKEDAALKKQAFAEIAAALRAEELVCIFPEGKLTRDGEIDEFRSGFVEVVRETPVPVIPMALRGLWSSIFSRNKEKRLERTFTRSFFSRLKLLVGEPVPPEEATPELLQERVQGLRGRSQ